MDVCVDNVYRHVYCRVYRHACRHVYGHVYRRGTRRRARWSIIIIIHYYSHIHADKKSEAGKLTEEHYKKITPVKSEILGSKIVRPVGPRYYQTVVDVKITK